MGCRDKVLVGWSILLLRSTQGLQGHLVGECSVYPEYFKEYSLNPMRSWKSFGQVSGSVFTKASDHLPVTATHPQICMHACMHAWVRSSLQPCVPLFRTLHWLPRPGFHAASTETLNSRFAHFCMTEFLRYDRKPSLHRLAGFSGLPVGEEEHTAPTSAVGFRVQGVGSRV